MLRSSIGNSSLNIIPYEGPPVRTPFGQGSHHQTGRDQADFRLSRTHRTVGSLEPRDSACAQLLPGKSHAGGSVKPFLPVTSTIEIVGATNSGISGSKEKPIDLDSTESSEWDNIDDYPELDDPPQSPLPLPDIHGSVKGDILSAIEGFTTSTFVHPQNLVDIAGEAVWVTTEEAGELSHTLSQEAAVDASRTLDRPWFCFSDEHQKERKNPHKGRDIDTQTKEGNLQAELKDDEERSDVSGSGSESEYSNGDTGSVFSDDQGSESDDDADSQSSSDEAELAGTKAETSQRWHARHSPKRYSNGSDNARFGRE